MDSSHSEEFVEVEPIKSSYATPLEVPNVQELVRKNPLQVPERYIRCQEDRPSNMEESCLSAMIPVIDFSLLSMRDQKELTKMDKACQEWGFFQLVNHGIAKEVINNMREAATKFFGLPLEEKEKYAMPADNIQGYGHAHVASEVQILDWSDVLVLLVHPSQYRMLNYWPKTPNNFKEIIEAYTDGINKVGEELLRSFSVLMGMDEEALLGIHKELFQALRLNYYPVCSKPDQVLGLSPHSDASTITILMQQQDVIGLQIKHDKKWISVKPIPTAFIVNAGDVMEILSNGKYKSIEHRVVTNVEMPRISYASFLAPHRDVEIEPIIEDMTNFVKKYKKVKYGDFLKLALKKLEGKTAIEILKIET